MQYEVRLNSNIEVEVQIVNFPMMHDTYVISWRYKAFIFTSQV